MSGEPVHNCAEHGPMPVEFVLHALAACLTTGIASIAAASGVTLDSIESTVTGDIDLRGMLDLSGDVRNGFEHIHIDFRLRSDDPGELAKIVDRSRKRSAVFDVLTNGVPVAITVETG